MKKRCMGALVLAVLMTSGAASAADERLEANKRTMILFKALTMDQNIAKGRDALRVGVVSRSGNAESARIAKEMLAAIKKVDKLKVRGLAISAVALAVDAAVALEPMVTARKVNILYLAPGVESMLEPICQLARQRRLIVLSGESAHAPRCAALTVVRQKGKPQLLVNRQAATAQGASFAPKLYKNAKTVN